MARVRRPGPGEPPSPLTALIALSPTTRSLDTRAPASALCSDGPHPIRVSAAAGSSVPDRRDDRGGGSGGCGWGGTGCAAGGVREEDRHGPHDLHGVIQPRRRARRPAPAPCLAEAAALPLPLCCWRCAAAILPGLAHCSALLVSQAAALELRALRSLRSGSRSCSSSCGITPSGPSSALPPESPRGAAAAQLATTSQLAPAVRGAVRPCMSCHFVSTVYSNISKSLVLVLAVKISDDLQLQGLRLRSGAAAGL